MIAKIVDGMGAMDLKTLIAGLDIHATNASADLSSVQVCDLTEDSRTAVPGSLFVARAGLSTDGKRYIEDAIECGAVAVLTDTAGIELPRNSDALVLVSKELTRHAALIAERFWGNPASALSIMGVTGTNGKTTVAHFVQQLVRGAGVRCGLIGTVVIDDGRECARASMTTPPAIELSRTLATMVEHRCEAVAMEVSSHALSQGRASALRFDAAVLTNITGDHLDYHKTPEGYADAKAVLFELLDAEAEAVFARGAPGSEGIAGRCAQGVHKRWCSLDGDTDWGVRVETESIDGMTLSVRTPMGGFTKRTKLIGSYNALNLVEAIASTDILLDRLNVGDAERLASYEKTLASIGLPPGRLERVDGRGDTVRVFVDFAHTDDALRTTLAGIRPLVDPRSKLWVVFGCGGDKDRTKRPRMGRVASEGADRVVVTSDNPRTEKPSAIVDEILSGIDPMARIRVDVQVDRGRAIVFAIEHAEPGDVVVIAGKGHETEQIVPSPVGGVSTIRFDDREHARVALRQRRLKFPAAGAS
ncbi:MAG: UDP-N-acetylmuramoyl-L-alanyl-D-glutamate--2,6-diaminopimelate ligase [Phycisphaerales bacterium]|nr:UDP-N-acetylmuramoyl-L-alanyl-D-glutamate--2,6-diaminopimelate ligase [Phycisphaerales bacterium]